MPNQVDDPVASCLFGALGAAMAGCLGKKKPAARQVRSEIVMHMKRHETDFSKLWDGAPSEAKKTVKDFCEYLTEMGRPGSRGG